jgi:PAS domain S-box-containing protein
VISGAIPAPFSTKAKQMKNILVVDNHPMIRRFMLDLLEKEGHQVRAAEDGLSALETLRDYRPDVLFVDLVMPNIDGEKLCQIIRKTPEMEGCFLAILSATAAEQEIDVSRFGADICIAKGPFSKMDGHVLAALSLSDSPDRGRKGRGRIQRVIGLEDVHSREITKELLMVKSHFEAVLGGLDEGMLEMTDDGRIVFANPSVLEIVGVPEERLLASDFADLFETADRSRVRAVLARKVTEGSVIEETPLALKGKLVEIKAIGLEDDPKKLIVILKDVTERQRWETYLREAKKMESIGTLAAGIAHDFNNILMGIQGNSSLMLLDINPTHQHYAKLKNIEKQIKSATKLTGQLLGYASKGRYEIRSINLNELIQETYEAFRSSRREITVRMDLAEDLADIQGDIGQIEQVLLNLFVNAGDAMPASGQLYLTTANTDHKHMSSKLYSPKEGRYVFFSITDTGTGMDPETQGRIFEPFFTTKEMGRGTGLGLASVYGILKGHGGYIDVESQKGMGTTFRFYLPAVERKPKAKPEAEEKKGLGKPQNVILLIDDEELFRKIGGDMLKALGYRILLASSGREAAELFRKNRNKVDLVILDIVMPEMRGSQVFDRLREIDPTVKILLASGYSIDGEATDLLERGCNGFIQKPFNLDRLSGAIRGILEKESPGQESPGLDGPGLESPGEVKA